MDKVDLDALEALEAKATEGPWTWYSVNDDDFEVLCGPFEDARDAEFKTISKNCVMDDGSASGEYGRSMGSDTPDGQLIAAMRNNIKPMIEELRAAREVIKTVEWAGSSPQSHGEDCDYWDFEAEAPSGEKCECGFTELREALNKYFEAVK